MNQPTLAKTVYPARHPGVAWMNGEIIQWEDCVLHVRTQGAFFGANIFEGLRAYWNDADQQLYVFRLEEHLTRLFQSMKIMRMQSAFSAEDLFDATLELLKRAEFREHAQANLVSYYGFPEPGDPLSHKTGTGAHITAVPMGRSPFTQNGISVGVSSWRRLADDMMPIRIKIGSNYQNSRLAQNEVAVAGYDMALLLNSSGKVCEAPGACIFMARGGVIYTPPTTADILESITRDTIIQLARTRLNMEVIERVIDRSELYIADEIFLCGSIAEVIPVTSIDGTAIGEGVPGNLTKKLQVAYFQAVEGKLPEFNHWCTPVYSEGRNL